MNKNDRQPITTSYEPNPLRPYYIPPTISDSASAAPDRPTSSSIPHTTRASSSFTTKQQDYLSSIDLDLRSSASEAWTNTRALLDTLAWRYASTLMAQPFDVAKTILQVSSADRSPQSDAARAQTRKSTGSRSRKRRSQAYDSYSETEDSNSFDRSEDDEIPDYFTSSVPRSRSPRRRRRTPPSLSPSPDPTPTPSRTAEQRHKDAYSSHKFVMKQPDSITNAIAEINRTSGAAGLWRANNCTFLYTIFLRTTDSFLRSLLLALVGLPEILGPEQGGLAPGLMSGHGSGTSGVDLTDSPNPLASLIIVGISSCITGILLAPLDLVRTRLVVGPTTLAPRGVLSNVRRLPSLLVPSMLWLPTALVHTVPNVISAAMPLLFRFQLRISPDTMPGAWSLASFTTTLVELFTRLPFETVLRRAQVKTLLDMDSSFPVIVPVAPYTGVMGTVYSIMYSEGETHTKSAKGMVKISKGQGLSGLIRGWRVGFWGLVGVWTVGAMTPVNESRRGQF